MEYILTHWMDIGTAILAILGAFSILAKLTPTKADDKIVDFLLKIVNTLGLTKKN